MTCRAFDRTIAMRRAGFCAGTGVSVVRITPPPRTLPVTLVCPVRDPCLAGRAVAPAGWRLQRASAFCCRVAASGLGSRHGAPCRRPRLFRAGRPAGPGGRRRRAGCRRWSAGGEGGRGAEQAAGGHKGRENRNEVRCSWSLLESWRRGLAPPQAATVGAGMLGVCGRSAAAGQSTVARVSVGQIPHVDGQKAREARRHRQRASRALSLPRCAWPGGPALRRPGRPGSGDRSPGCSRASARVDGDELAADLVDVAGALGALAGPARSSAITSPSARPRWHGVLVEDHVVEGVAEDRGLVADVAVAAVAGAADHHRARLAGMVSTAATSARIASGLWP